MRGGRAKLPVLAEIAGPAGGSRIWSLRRDDNQRLAAVSKRLEGQRTVLVSGAEEVTGALAIALAGAACAAGRRTILVECDLTRPRLAAELGLAEVPGLHEYLRWEATAAEVLRPLALGGVAAAGAAGPLVCVPAGRQAADARVLLWLQSFRHMTAKLRNAYDLVVLAGPPLGFDPEALSAVAAQADGVLAALPAAQSSRRGRRAARAAVGQLPAPPLGAVVVGEA
jgi:Mrp family chromosome partitioning ATPase